MISVDVAQRSRMQTFSFRMLFVFIIIVSNNSKNHQPSSTGIIYDRKCVFFSNVRCDDYRDYFEVNTNAMTLEACWGCVHTDGNQVYILLTFKVIYLS